ncbi:hypothetical protein HDG41_002339 [Paraburkholderia sp. JPY162]|uniref:Uncharacterized protein n=1 Tax=Paraburkholderia youngii TaxID=2782701 RepID=A0A7W8P2R7_9BURK|nr:hypothetical protein [Paraburkholderia youngii]
MPHSSVGVHSSATVCLIAKKGPPPKQLSRLPDNDLSLGPVAGAVTPTQFSNLRGSL